MKKTNLIAILNKLAIAAKANCSPSGSFPADENDPPCYCIEDDPSDGTCVFMCCRPREDAVLAAKDPVIDHLYDAFTSMGWSCYKKGQPEGCERPIWIPATNSTPVFVEDDDTDIHVETEPKPIDMQGGQLVPIEAYMRNVNTRPTDEMARLAARGLELRKKYNRGGTGVGVARARDISNKVLLSPRTVSRMNSFFARHRVDLNAMGARSGQKGYPSAGAIAWMLWGGDPNNPDGAGASWAARKAKELKNQ